MHIAIFEEIVRKLGGQEVVGTPIRSQTDLALSILNRLPLSALGGLVKAGLSEVEIEMFVIPQRTCHHRADQGQPLTVEESDRVVRFLRIQTIAEHVFGDKEKAYHWLRRPLIERSGETPLILSQTDAGARVTEAILDRIAWGAVA